MKLAQLLVFRLRLDRGARFRFFHNPTVYAYLMDRLGTPPTFPKRCFFLAPESGRSCYEPGDEYRFGLVLLPGAEMDAAGWGHRLRRGPRSPWALKRGAPLGQGAELVEVVDGVTGQVVHDPSDAQWLTLRQVERAAFGLAGQQRVTLTFQSPLLILRTPVHTSRFFMDDRVVDGATVLHRVRARVHEHFPGLAPLGPAPAVEGVVNGLVRADAKYPNKTLLGSVGSVTLELGEPLSAPWARALVLAGLVGIGKSTTMGQGRYGVEGAEPTAAWPPQPAQTCCERAARSSVVERVLASMRTAGPDDGGSDDGCEQGGVTERELEGLMARSSALRDALARGRVGAAPSLGLRASVSGGAVDPLVALALEDRFLQQCCY
ncbi:MAG: hypothetical protein KC501_40740, partial [Myxococcales bacterium]|nr:hypothetical protein [Myxococcales bacterium]